MPLLTLTPTFLTVNIKDFYHHTPTMKQCKYMRIIPVTLLYYAQAVDSFMLVALGSLASAQSTKTKATCPSHHSTFNS
jgi:hypothetical protein